MNKTLIASAVAAVALAGCTTAEKTAPAAADKCTNCKCTASQPVKKARPVSPSCKVSKMPFKLGFAGYTFYKDTTDSVLAKLKRIDCHYLCIKPNFIDYMQGANAPIAEFKAKCAAAGVECLAAGPLYYKDAATARKLFEFAKAYGMKTVLVVPYGVKDGANQYESEEMLDVLDALVKEFDIRYAIHNHGPASPNMYPDVAYGWNLVKELDPRIGFCMDVGWEYGCGKDPAETIRQYGSRIYDLHFKNFEKNKPNGASTPLPRGKINFVKVLKALRDIGYAGVCALEYERDFQDNIVPIAECVGYYRGLVDALED